MRIENSALTFDTTDLSQTTATSNAVHLSHISQYAVQIVTSGSPTGVFKIQVSCDLGRTNGSVPTNWSDLASATMAVSAAGISFINLVDAGYSWFRVVYTKTSGTGAITSARFHSKGV